MTEIRVDDRMQRNYRYIRVAQPGRGFDTGFTPDLTPAEMLELGVFCGKYMTDCRAEFPANWFENARLAPDKPDCSLNYFGVKASKPLSYWQDKGWVHPYDPRGWFQWYCRYWSGRRMEDDARQIGRWRAFARHAAQVRKHCEPCDHSCRRRQRQALLQWAYDSRAM